MTRCCQCSSLEGVVIILCSFRKEANYMSGGSWASLSMVDLENGYAVNGGECV